MYVYNIYLSIYTYIYIYTHMYMADEEGGGRGADGRPV